MTRFKLASPKKGIRTRIKIAEYIDTLHKIRNAALDSLHNRAFGELDNFKDEGQISYEDWRNIYLKHEWVEAPEYQCFYNPKNETQLGDVKIRNQLIKGERAYEYKNYKQEMLYVYSYEVWNKYLTSWKLKYSLIEATPIDLSILTSLSKITIEEALFVTLGISPSVLLESGFHDWDLFELKPPQEKEIDFKDYKGRDCKISSGINNLIEDKLTHTSEYKILIREFGGKQINTKDFIDWALRSEHIQDNINVEEPYTEEVDLFAKDKETQILNSRLRIYKETLPNYLERSEPLSIRKLTIATNGLKTYEYYNSIKDFIGGTSAELARKEIGRLVKSSWWKKQPKEVREKIKKK
jgi:hypothetical protein